MNLPAVAIPAAFAGGFARRAEIRFPACRFTPLPGRIIGFTQ
jgi:hypothetical protein